MDLFIFQVNAVSGQEKPKREEVTISQFRTYCEQAIISSRHGEPKRVTISELDKKYSEALLALPKKNKAENIAKLDEIYTNALVNLRPVAKQENEFMTISAARKSEIEKEATKFISDYANFALSLTNPSAFYGQDLLQPAKAKELLNSFDDLTGKMNGKDEIQFLQENMLRFAENRYLALANAGMNDPSKLYQRIILAPFENQNLDVARGSMRSAMQYMTNVQKAVDGLTMLSKSMLDKSYSLPNNAVMAAYFTKILGSDGEAQKFVKDYLAGGASAKDAVARLFEKLNSKNEYRDYATLVLESNYGEKAGVLDNLFPLLGAGNNRYLDAINKAESFFTLLAGNEYAQKKWAEFKGKLSGTASDLISQKQYLLPGNSTATRDKYDVVTALSFLSAYEKSEYIKSTWTDQYAREFLGIIGGTDQLPQPTPVPSTILQHHKAIDTFYARTEDNPQQFLRIANELALAVSTIYQQGFGASFNISPNDFSSIESRVSAANRFMSQITVLSSDKLLADLMYRYMNSQRPPISLLPPEQLVSVVPPVQDIDNVGTRLHQYVAGLPLQFDDLNGYQRSVEDYLTRQPEAPYAAKASKYLAQIGFRDFADAYLNTIHQVFSSIMSKRTPFNPNLIEASGYENYLRNINELERTNVNASLSGYNGYVSNSYNRNKYFTYDNMGKEASGSDYLNELFRMQNVQSPAGMPVQIYNAYLNYVRDHQTNVGYEKVSQEMNSQLNADVNRAGNLAMVLHTNSLKENGQWKVKNLWADTYVRRNEGWYRVYFRDDQNGDDLKNRLTHKYAEMSVSLSPETLFRGGLEEQYRNDDKGTYRKDAFFLGFETNVRDKRTAVLGVQTVSGNAAALGSKEIRKSKDNNPRVVTLGWLDLTHTETNADGTPVYGNQQPQVGVQNPDQTGGEGQFILPKEKIFLASKLVVSKFYGMMMGGGDIAGGVARWKHAGAGAVAQFNHGIRKFYGNGMVSNAFFDANAFVKADESAHPSYGGIVTVHDVAGGELTISGKVNSERRINNQTVYTSVESLMARLDTLMSDISTNTGGTAWGQQDQYPLRQNKTEEWTKEAIAILEQLRILVPTDILGNVLNDYSISYQKDNHVHKISLSRIAGPGNKDGNYVVTMHDFNINDQTSVSITAGVKAFETASKYDNQSGAKPSNFGGMKFRHDNTCFGFTSYNLFSPDQAHVATIAHDFDGEKKLMSMLNIKAMPGRGGMVDFYLGNVNYRFKAEYENVSGMQSGSVAADYNINKWGKIFSSMIPVYAGAGIRYTEANELHVTEPRLHLSTSPTNDFSISLDAGAAIGKTPNGKYVTATGTITMRYKF